MQKAQPSQGGGELTPRPPAASTLQDHGSRVLTHVGPYIISRYVIGRCNRVVGGGAVQNSGILKN